MIRVLISSKRSLSAELLAAAIRIQPGLELVQLAETDEELLSTLEQKRIDVLLVNTASLDSTEQLGETLRRIRDLCPSVKVVVLATKGEPNLVVTAFSNGTKGIFSLSDSSLESLCKCIERVHQGQIWASSQELQWVMQAFEQSKVKSKPLRVVNAVGTNLLSKREEEVARLLLDGLQNRDIAQTLNLSEHTIKNYLFRIYDKLGISSRTELLLYLMTPREVAPMRKLG